VYAVPGDTGRGSEGRPNAGFVVTDSGVVVIEALGSPWQAKQLRAVIATATHAPVRWLILTHHHPDHMMGAVVFVRDGARVLAHPDRTMLAGENGDDALLADWDGVVGLHELQGFTFADKPNVAITHDTTVSLGGRRIVLYHPAGAAHSPSDLAIWIPDARVLFAGDLLIEDGVTMVVDGNSGVLRQALDHLDSFGARVVVPGHGRIARDPHAQIALTRAYVDSLRTGMRQAVERGTPMTRVLATLPPPDSGRPVSIASRRQRNAERVYLEMEKQLMGVGDEQPAARPTNPNPGSGAARSAPRNGPALISTDSLATLIPSGAVSIIDVRTDISYYLKSHIPGAVYLNSESLRSMADGVPNLLLPAASYVTLFNRLGIRAGRPVVIYSAGDTRNIDATYLSWILSGFAVPSVAILDGGFAKWELESRPTLRTYPSAVRGSFSARAFAPARATLQEIRRFLGLDGARPSNVVLVDARPPDQYAGQAGAQLRHGHIPGAISHPWATDLTDGLTHVFKPLDTIRASYVAQNITPEKDIIAYCNGGLESSHLYFVLHDLLKYPHVRVYDGSWTEYSVHEELPAATGPNP
jgi:thiosulfate/3-mercaptopyruvate sulfurtransferase